MTPLFGTDGVRGIANQPPMTAEIALQLGRAAAHVLKEYSQKTKVVIGKDTRLSCYMIETALASGFCSMGANVYLVGPLPTPAIAMLTEDMRCDAGVMISASHNPYKDNGIKFFSSDGFKLSDRTEHKIEYFVRSNGLDTHRPTAKDVGKIFRIDDAMGRYIHFLKHTFPQELKLDGVKIVVDCANGATYKVAPLIFEELGATVIKLHTEPDGTNINDQCGSTSPRSLSEAVVTQGADVGFAFDGDGDRLVPVDHKGNILDGDFILAIAARYLQKSNRLNKNTVVATVMSNLGLEIALKRLGITLLRAQVGDRSVCEAMIKDAYTLGGEQSGHIIFLDDHKTGDGIIAALKLLAVILQENQSLNDLSAIMNRYPQTLINVPVPEKKPLGDFPNIQRRVDEIASHLDTKGRILLRSSGTENKIRVMVEGEDQKEIQAYAAEIAEMVREAMSQ